MKKILVIEDNFNVRENLAELLELSGYLVQTAADGKMGVEAALKEPPDLILCDVMMPELDGYGVLHILGKRQLTADIPFIFLTAKSEREDFRKGMTMGADDYITKPFDDVQLLETIASRLEKCERLRHSGLPEQDTWNVFFNETKAQEALFRLVENRETRYYHKKDVIFREGSYPRWLYYIESGEVKLFKTSDDGRDFIVKISRSGDFLGYLALLNERPYTESAAAIEEVQVKLIPSEDFNKLVYGNKDVSVRFIKFLASHISSQEQQLINLAYNSVRKRVADALVSLYGSDRREINILREDLAALAGTAKETAIRTLADFKAEKIINIKESVITVLQIEKLKNMPS